MYDRREYNRREVGEGALRSADHREVFLRLIPNRVGSPWGEVAECRVTVGSP